MKLKFTVWVSQKHTKSKYVCMAKVKIFAENFPQ